MNFYSYIILLLLFPHKKHTVNVINLIKSTKIYVAKLFIFQLGGVLHVGIAGHWGNTAHVGLVSGHFHVAVLKYLQINKTISFLKCLNLKILTKPHDWPQLFLMIQ